MHENAIIVSKFLYVQKRKTNVEFELRLNMFNYKYHNSQRTVALKLVKGTKTCIFLGIKLYSSQHNI
jgi:hypothetical protein